MPATAFTLAAPVALAAPPALLHGCRAAPSAPSAPRAARVAPRMTDDGLAQPRDPAPPAPPPGGLLERARRWADKRRELAAALRAYGVAAVISYGLFDLITYSASLLIALRGFVAAGTPVTLPKLFAVVWSINNFSRPLRVTGALALAPIVDRTVVKPIRRLLQRFRKERRAAPEDRALGDDAA